MKPRVKLLTPWCGDLPPWIDQFRERMVTNKLVNWQLYQTDVIEMNIRASQVSGVHCVKREFYATCDYRPLFGQMFADLIGDAEWWGWCDLDIAVGNLDKLLGPLLDSYDVITTDASYVHGPFTLIRNTPRMNQYCMVGAVVDVLKDWEYWNFDENGFNNPRNQSLTRQLKRDRTVRTRWDDRVWTENQWTIENGIPSRGCEMKGDDLIEVPTGRQLLLYHFTSKVWPLPNRWARYREVQVDRRGSEHPPEFAASVLQQETPEYWSARINRVLRAGEPVYKIVADVTDEDWFKLQQYAGRVLEANVRKGGRVLDVGCGFGALLDAFDDFTQVRPDYFGVDYCSEMVETAGRRHTGLKRQFMCMDAREMLFKDDSFDAVVCRGLEGSVKTLVSNADWVRMRTEMLRVAQKVVLLDTSYGHRILTRS